eukprot:7391995-Prymnesium_polylepis.3
MPVVLGRLVLLSHAGAHQGKGLRESGARPKFAVDETTANPFDANVAVRHQDDFVARIGRLTLVRAQGHVTVSCGLDEHQRRAERVVDGGSCDSCPAVRPAILVDSRVDAVAHPLLQRLLLPRIAIDQWRVHCHLIVHRSRLCRRIDVFGCCQSDARLPEPREELGHALDDGALAHHLEGARGIVLHKFAEAALGLFDRLGHLEMRWAPEQTVDPADAHRTIVVLFKEQHVEPRTLEEGRDRSLLILTHPLEFGAELTLKLVEVAIGVEMIPGD